MDTKDDQIEELLSQGYSYSEIQEGLVVSPNRISAVKKRMNNDSSSNDGLSRPTLIDNREAIPINQSEKTLIFDENFRKNPIEHTFSQSHRVLSPEEIELEKMRLQLNHEEKMAQIRQEERKIMQNQESLEIKQENKNHVVNKHDPQYQDLLSRFENIADRCEEGEWHIDDIEEYLEDIEQLIDEYEEFKAQTNITIGDLPPLVILLQMQEYFSRQMDNTDEDEVIDLSFPIKLLRSIEPYQD